MKKHTLFLILGFLVMLMVTSCKKEFTVISNENQTTFTPTNQDSISEVANTTAPVMEFEKREHNFGLIKEGTKVYYIFNFRNTGNSNLIISNATASCGCTIPEYPKKPIKVGETGKIKVSFNTTGKSGNQQKTVNITTNTAAGKELLTIRAFVKTE